MCSARKLAAHPPLTAVVGRRRDAGTGPVGQPSKHDVLEDVDDGAVPVDVLDGLALHPFTVVHYLCRELLEP
jgi:hypothetical protein